MHVGCVGTLVGVVHGSVTVCQDTSRIVGFGLEISCFEAGFIGWVMIVDIIVVLVSGSGNTRLGFCLFVCSTHCWVLFI